MSKAQQDILNRYRKTTIIGAGVIGASWTALFLAHGLVVVVNDRVPNVASSSVNKPHWSRRPYSITCKTVVAAETANAIANARNMISAANGHLLNKALPRELKKR